MIKDDHMTAPGLPFGVVADVLQVLNEHGYQPPSETRARHRAHGGALWAIYKLVQEYTGHND